MSVFAISDLHLAISSPDKSMELFGDDWKDYHERIKNNWKKTVTDSDTVIVPGDISWALNIDEAYEDFKYLHTLPGKKIIMKGNHDYYFSTVAKLKSYLKENHFDSIEVLNHNSICVEEINICGTRLWGNSEIENANDAKIYRRELIRLKMSLNSISAENIDKPIVVVTHFPPFRQEVTELLKQYDVKMCIYGHLHGEGHYMVKEGLINGIEYKMVSGDYTKFNLVKIK